MQKELSNYRKSYEKSELTEETIKENPMEQFQKWFYEVEASNGVDEPNAMTVSTIGLDGFPKSRVVLMKKFTFEGWVKDGFWNVATLMWHTDNVKRKSISFIVKFINKNVIFDQ